MLLTLLGPNLDKLGFFSSAHLKVKKCYVNVGLTKLHTMYH